MEENKNEVDQVNKKDSFLLYNSMYATIKKIPDEIVGKVIKSVFEYSISKKLPDYYDDATVESVLFSLIQNSLDINEKKYFEKCEKNRENINKRWKEKNKEKTNQKEVVFVNNEMLTEEEYKSRFKEFTYEYEDVLYMERELLKKGEIEKIKTTYNNDEISEEKLREYIKIR